MNLLIRVAQPGDRTAPARVMGESFLADQTRFLREVDGRTVGMVQVQGPKIEALNILPNDQRRGIGTAVMDWVERRLVGVGYATLDNQEANAAARAFYERRGYRFTRCWEETRLTRIPFPMVTLRTRPEEGGPGAVGTSID